MVTDHHPGLEQLLGAVGEAMTTPVLVLRCVERLLWPGPTTRWLVTMQLVRRESTSFFSPNSSDVKIATAPN